MHHLFSGRWPLNAAGATKKMTCRWARHKRLHHLFSSASRTLRAPAPLGAALAAAAAEAVRAALARGLHAAHYGRVHIIGQGTEVCTIGARGVPQAVGSRLELGMKDGGRRRRNGGADSKRPRQEVPGEGGGGGGRTEDEQCPEDHPEDDEHEDGQPPQLRLRRAALSPGCNAQRTEHRGVHRGGVSVHKECTKSTERAHGGARSPSWRRVRRRVAAAQAAAAVPYSAWKA